jgi:hypothetical protein
MRGSAPMRSNYRPGVLDEVSGQLNGGGEGVGADRPGPAITEVADQMQEAGETAGGAGELGRPPGQMSQVAAAGGQPRLQLALEAEQQLPRRLVEGERGRPVLAGGDGQAGRQGLELDAQGSRGRVTAPAPTSSEPASRVLRGLNG